jgi:hypothetical protein
MGFKKHNFACGFFHGCETLSLTLREEQRLGCLRIGYSRRYLGLREMMKRGSGEDYITRSFIMSTPPNVIRAIKLRKIRLDGYVARMGEKICAYRVLLEKLEEAKSLGRIILEWPFKEMDRGHGLD